MARRLPASVPPRNLRKRPSGLARLDSNKRVRSGRHKSSFYAHTGIKRASGRYKPRRRKSRADPTKKAEREAKRATKQESQQRSRKKFSERWQRRLASDAVAAAQAAQQPDDKASQQPDDTTSSDAVAAAQAAQQPDDTASQQPDDTTSETESSDVGSSTTSLDTADMHTMSSSSSGSGAARTPAARSRSGSGGSQADSEGCESFWRTVWPVQAPQGNTQAGLATAALCPSMRVIPALEGDQPLHWPWGKPLPRGDQHATLRVVWRDGMPFVVPRNSDIVEQLDDGGASLQAISQLWDDLPQEEQCQRWRACERPVHHRIRGKSGPCLSSQALQRMQMDTPTDAQLRSWRLAAFLSPQAPAPSTPVRTPCGVEDMEALGDILEFSGVQQTTPRTRKHMAASMLSDSPLWDACR